MKKLICILLGALLFPIIIFMIIIVIPLLLFLIVLKMLTFKSRRKSPHPAPSAARKTHRPDDVVDIECEVMDDKGGK
jgi:predicted lipid-binding transport protein (Tim44 family)